MARSPLGGWGCAWDLSFFRKIYYRALRIGRLARLHQDLAVAAAAGLLDRLHHGVEAEAGGDGLPVVDGAAGHQADDVGEDLVAGVALEPKNCAWRTWN